MPPMDTRQLAIVAARARAVIGLSAMVLPGTLTSIWLGTGAVSSHSRVLARAMGARDLVLGIGALTTVKEQTSGPEWLSMGAMADGVDALLSLVARDVPRRTRLFGLAAAVSAVAGMKLARDLADERDATAAVATT
jgi:hypothetical protein